MSEVLGEALPPIIRRKDNIMANDTNDDGAVCTKCGTTVESREDWDADHQHGAR